MKDNGIFDVSGVTFENLRSISESCEVEFEERVCELALLADRIASDIRMLADDGMSLVDALTALTEEFELFKPQPSKDILDINRNYVDAFNGALCDFDKLIFSKLLCEKLRQSGCMVKENDFLSAELRGSRITYVRSTLTDEAYDVFSQNFEDPRIMYASSTREALRCVANGESDYCIVPFEEKGGARVSGVSSMIATLDLKIAEVTPVFGPEGTADVKYALVGTAFCETSWSKDDDLYLELLIPTDSSLSIGRILSSTEQFGYFPYRIGSVEYEVDGERVTAVSLSLRDDGNDFLPLLVFLTMFADDYTPIGFYKNIE